MSTARSSSRSMPSSGEACSSEYDEYEEDDKSAAKIIIPESLDLLLEFQNLTYNVQHTDALCGVSNPRNRRGRQCTHMHGVDHAEQRANSMIEENSNDVKILHNILGAVKGGEIMAVMGPSGSSKMTLINMLAQRISHGSLQRSITLNGEEVKSNNIIYSVSAYVMQDDLLFPMLTVKETLRFAVELHLHNCSAEKVARVDKVLTQLNLTKVADTIVGDEGHHGILGGERKRLSIGKEILHDPPSILFLDEPTSGLDSTNALLVVSTLHWQINIPRRQPESGWPHNSEAT